MHNTMYISILSLFIRQYTRYIINIWNILNIKPHILISQMTP